MQTIKVIKKAFLLPCTSEMILTTINPVKEPKGKKDWIRTLIHCLSQNNPIEDVKVKLSTKIKNKLPG